MIPIGKPIIGDEEKKAVLEVLNSGHLVQGPKVKEFEEEFSKYVGVKNAIATSSGTTALHLMLLAYNIKKGDEVITTPFSFFASSSCILFCNAMPIFVDIEEDTFNINAEKIEAAITKRTKMILPVHLFGQPADMDVIMDIADRYDLVVIEDACQAHGAEFGKKRVGSIGHAGCFSFYPSKNMVAGEGGMVTTNDDEIAEKIRSLRDHGQKRQYEHLSLGYNFRMMDISAAIGIEQLKKLEGFNTKRIHNAKFLSAQLEKVKGITLPFVKENRTHVFHQYSIKVEDDFPLSRDDLLVYLIGKGIGARKIYPMPIYDQPIFKKLGYKGKCEVTEDVAKKIMQLPVHPSLSADELQYIVDGIKTC